MTRPARPHPLWVPLLALLVVEAIAAVALATGLALLCALIMCAAVAYAFTQRAVERARVRRRGFAQPLWEPPFVVRSLRSGENYSQYCARADRAGGLTMSPAEWYGSMFATDTMIGGLHGTPVQYVPQRADGIRAARRAGLVVDVGPGTVKLGTVKHTPAPPRGTVEHDRLRMRVAFANSAMGKMTQQHCGRPEDHDPHGDPKVQWCSGTPVTS